MHVCTEVCYKEKSLRKREGREGWRKEGRKVGQRLTFPRST